MHIKLWLPVIIASTFIGCASVPKADLGSASQTKQLTAPTDGNARIYVYRSNNIVGGAIKKDIWIDGECLGESARGVFFYKDVQGNREHVISTESEFSPNHLKLQTESGQQYYIQQYIKPGVLVGGANLKQVDSSVGEKAVSEYQLAQSGKCSKPTISLSDEK